MSVETNTTPRPTPSESSLDDSPCSADLDRANAEEERLWEQFSEVSQRNGAEIDRLVKEADDARKLWASAYERRCEIKRQIEAKRISSQNKQIEEIL